MIDPRPAAGALPPTQHAVQFTGPGRLVHNRAKAVHVPGPTQLLLRVEAVGICFSDTKLLHAFTGHLRKAEVTAGLTPAELAEIPSYVPGDLPTVPGHEVAGRIVAIGSAVTRHAVGERVLVQTDYRHLPTPGSNAAFGYNFEGGLQEYVLLDERMIIEPGTGERFLIPVGETPSGSAVALLEPWACVEASYACRERNTLAPGGRLLVVADPGCVVDGLVPLLAAASPGVVIAACADEGQRAAVEAAIGATVEAVPGAAGPARPALEAAGSLDDVAPEPFDDIVYFGADPARIEALQDRLATRGVIDVVLGGAPIGRPVAVDVGRIHYDLLRWVGTPGSDASEGYRLAAADGELRAGDRVAVIGAAGPMGFMHVIRTITSGLPGVSLTAVDIDDARLAQLGAIAGPLAAARGIPATFANARTTRVEPGFDYVGVMVPAPAIVAQAVDLAGPGARVNLFAGFAAGTRAALDLDTVIGRHLYLFGTSGSEIPDMKVVLHKLERGDLDTNLSVDAVTGMEGVRDALAAVEARTSGGKIVVYPQLHEMGMIRLSELAGRFPTVAAALHDGRWTRAAEEALLAAADDASLKETAR
ncbi:MAG TPA: alcohol dehydrogenase catalytic domain-containing protein [Candidatus Limnocylindrales bacterium]